MINDEATTHDKQETVGVQVEPIVMMQQDSRWIICWECRNGNKNGHGSPLNKKTANERCASANIDYPEIKHWIIAA